MTIDEVIEEEKIMVRGATYGNYSRGIKYHTQIVEWLEELKELRAYKERMEMQYLDDIDNPLEPLKLCHALKSELFKYDYRKEHKPEAITVIDYTIMYALKHCLEEQLRILKAKNEI